jgi:hypothetical protein
MGFQKLLKWTIFTDFSKLFAADFRKPVIWLLVVFGNPFVTASVAFEVLFNP